MKAVSGSRFYHLLELKEWELRRVHGSHHIYAKAENISRISVPVHGSTVLKISLQRHLMKVAAIEEWELSKTLTHTNVIRKIVMNTTFQDEWKRYETGFAVLGASFM